MTITTLGLTGFEHGFIAAAANAGGGLFDAAPGSGWSASTTSPRNGSYCAHLVAPANTATRLLNNIAGSPTKVVVRFAVKVSARPSSAVSEIACLSGASVAIWSLQVTSAGVLQASAGTGAFTTGPTIDTTGWHLIEMQSDSAAGTVDWKVDGVLQTRPATSAQAAATQIWLGVAAATRPAFTADYDDVIIGTWTVAGTDWYGDGKVLAQLPGVDGTHNVPTAFAFGDAGAAWAAGVTNAYTYVDDPPGTGGWTATRSTTDNITNRAAATASRAEMRPAPTAETATANAVKAIMSYSSPTTTANLAACDVRNTADVVTEIWGVTSATGTGKPYNVTANNFKSALVVTPAAGWTAAEVNAIRVRFGGCASNDVSPVPTLQAWMLEVDWPISAPSGTDYFQTPADTLAISDSITPLLIAPILLPLAELLTVTDTKIYSDLGGTYASLATDYTDYLDLGNAVKIDTGTAVPLADTLSVADARTLDVGKLLNDPLTVADANWRDAAKPLADTLTVTDQATPLAALQYATADSLTVADQASSLAVLQRTLGDLLAVSDGQAIRFDALRAVADTLTLADLADPVLTIGSIAHQVPLADPLTINDVATPLAMALIDRALTDTLAIADAQVTEATLLRALTDPLTILDASTQAADRAQALADTLAVVDQYAGVNATARAFADTLTLVDTPSTIAGFAFTPADALGVTDQQASLSTVQRAFAEDLTLADLASPLLGGGAALVQPLADVLALTDNFVQLSSFDRLLAETLTVTDLLSSTATYTRTVADTLAVADQIALLQLALLAFNDPLTLVDLASPFHSTGTPHQVPLADALSLIDSLDSTAAYLRSQADPLALADSFGSETGLTMTRAETLTIVDNRTSVMARSAELSDVLTIVDAQTRAAQARLAFPETLVIADVFLPFYVQYRPPRLTMIL